MKMTPELLKTIENSTRTKTRMTLTDFFDSYENPYNLTRKQLTDITHCFNLNLMMSIAETGNAYKLPSAAGVLGIEKKKLTRSMKIIDFHLFNKTGIKVHFKNNHSGNYVASFFWTILDTSPRLTRWLADVWSFSASRDINRYTAYLIKTHNNINAYHEY